MSKSITNYILRFNGEISSAEVTAELHSANLDPLLHPKNFVTVIFETDAKKRKKYWDYPLSDFQINSLLDYLQQQSKLRKILEVELPKDRDRWDAENESKSKNKKIWEAARVCALRLRQKNIPSPELMVSLKRMLSPEGLMQELSARDTPDTVSYFALEMECDWDDEHVVQAIVRDGEFVEINHE